MSASTDPAELSARRLQACDELARHVARMLGPVPTPKDRPWVEQRQVELILRALRSLQGVVVLARAELWEGTYALARMLLEDAAVAHWLAVHPDVPALQARWQEHLDSARAGDCVLQLEMGLVPDDDTRDWHDQLSASYLVRLRRHREGAMHWTGKTVAELVAGAQARAAPAHTAWRTRVERLALVQKRMLVLMGLGVHHSPAASQNWYAPPHQLLPDALRVAWLAFGLHAALALELLAPDAFDALDSLLDHQQTAFHSP